MWARLVTVAGLLLVAGCQDPIARASWYGGLAPFDPPSGELVEVLDTSSVTPAKQGLLYTAMQDAEFAGQYAGRALARLDEPGQMKTAVGEVIYAIEPAEAPDWEAKRGGFVAGWASRGYGLRRALNGMAVGIGAAGEGSSASAALREQGPRALQCTENTLHRADRVLVMSQQVLAMGQGADVEPTLRQLIELAEALNRGLPSPDEGGCGLEDVKRYLEQVVPDVRPG
jgi:hypothetical protein